MIDMISLGKYCVAKGHKNRAEYTVDGKKVEICMNCIENAIESLKIDSGWYDFYDRI